MRVNLQAHSSYVHRLRAELPVEAFQPSTKPLALLALHVWLIVAGLAGLGAGVGGMWAAPLFSLLIGHSFAGVAFLGHEILHGAVVRGRKLQNALGWLCLLPFALSPVLWRAWHNRVHHGNTMVPGVDPDAFPTLEVYQSSSLVRRMERFSVAKGHRWAWLSFAIGFTGQSLQILLYAGERGYLSKPQHRRAKLETAAGLAVWVSLGALFGARVFVFGYVIPLLIANAVTMAYIMTNHHLSPLTEVNDPLLNSLTVTVPPFWNVLHSRFGLHVEHHLFPSMSAAQLVRVRELLVKHWPERYQSMPLLRALCRLASTPRIYQEHTVMVDPSSGFTHTALLPRPSDEPLPRLRPPARRRDSSTNVVSLS